MRHTNLCGLTMCLRIFCHGSYHEAEENLSKRRKYLDFSFMLVT